MARPSVIITSKLNRVVLLQSRLPKLLTKPNMLLNRTAYIGALLNRFTQFANFIYACACLGNLLMILLYHLALPQSFKTTVAYVFVYFISAGFLPALVASVLLVVFQKQRHTLQKNVVEKHLKFIFMGVITFVVLNAHHFLLSLLN